LEDGRRTRETEEVVILEWIYFVGLKDSSEDDVP
jgi:hypothetical protein